MSTLRLVKPSECPPDGFRYVFPEDGYIAHAWTHTDWVNDATRHYQVNPGLGAVPPDLVERMEDQLCQTQEPGRCMYDDPNRPRVSTSFGWDDVVQGLTVFKEWLLGGRERVEQVEAERRGEICTRCFMNVNVQGCAGCQKLVAEVSGKLKSKNDFALRSCAVCKCFLKLKVHFPLQLLLDNEDEKLQSLYPSHCWLKRGGENFEPGVSNRAEA
jgi:hypothetical protein